MAVSNLEFSQIKMADDRYLQFTKLFRSFFYANRRIDLGLYLIVIKINITVKTCQFTVTREGAMSKDENSKSLWQDLTLG